MASSDRSISRLLIRILAAAACNVFSFSVVTYVMAANTTEEPNGPNDLFGIGRVGYFLSVIGTVRIAVASGIILGIFAPKLIQRVPSIIAASVLLAVFITGFLFALAFAAEPYGNYYFLSPFGLVHVLYLLLTPPFLIIMGAATVSNLITLFSMRFFAPRFGKTSAAVRE